MKLNIMLCITLFGSIYSHEAFSCEKSVNFANLKGFDFPIDTSDAIGSSEKDYSTKQKLNRMEMIAAQLISQSGENDLNPLKKALYRQAAKHIYSRLSAIALDRDIAGVETDDEIAALRKDLASLATETVLEQKKQLKQ